MSAVDSKYYLTHAVLGLSVQTKILTEYKLSYELMPSEDIEQCLLNYVISYAL